MTDAATRRLRLRLELDVEVDDSQVETFHRDWSPAPSAPALVEPGASGGGEGAMLAVGSRDDRVGRALVQVVREALEELSATTGITPRGATATVDPDESPGA